MSGDLLDIFLIVAAVAFAFSGYRQGFVVGALGLVGFVGGGLLGMKLAPPLAHSASTPGAQAIVAIAVVFAGAALGQLVAVFVGGAIRRRLRWHLVRVADSTAGAVTSVVSVLLVAWLLGSAVAQSPFTTLARQVRHSAVLRVVDEVMPEAARTWFAEFRRLVDQNGFPAVFGHLGPTTVVAVPAPDPAVLNEPGVVKARPSIVKVFGTARSCNRTVEGSGFVFAPNRVMTNAHVVAGVHHPVVILDNGARTLDAVVVLYDPNRDVAVLDVPGLDRAALVFDGTARTGESAVVAGYPENGPFDVVAARIRGEQEARGPNIYQNAQVTRDIYSLRATVRPGNSGGPLLAPDGRVYGVVFAASIDNPDTGYALTAAEVASDAQAGRTATAPVSTQACD